MNAILFVCLGNICRSPAAEAVVRHLAPGLTLDSAGTGNWHVGAAPYGPMQAVAKRRGYDLTSLRARQVQPGDFDRFDLIIAMDSQNRADLEAIRPAGNATPITLFTDYGPADGSAVPDPYFTRDFEGCLDLIETCAGGLSRRYAPPSR